jgi:hypothetical protein
VALIKGDFMNDKIFEFESLKPLKGLKVVKTASEVEAINKSRALAAAKERREAPLKNNQLARQLKDGLKSLKIAVKRLED